MQWLNRMAGIDPEVVEGLPEGETLRYVWKDEWEMAEEGNEDT